MRLPKIVGICLCAFALTQFCVIRATDEVEDEDVPEDSAEEPSVSFQPLEYVPPEPLGHFHFADCFKERDGIGRRWFLSKAKKEGISEDIAKFDGEWEISEPMKVALKNDYGLVMKSRAHHHAISAKLTEKFDFSKGRPLIVTYDVSFQAGHECGGAYVKLLSFEKDLDLKNFHDKTPYTIMFGPDRCGLTSKLHFIIRYKNPKTGVYEEKHAKQPDAKSFEHVFSDSKSHLFTLYLNADSSYRIEVDEKEVTKGSLLETVSPAIEPPREVDDPSDKKPDDWDDRERIPDPDAKKPEDWDESAPEFIEDETAVMPSGWNEDEPENIPDPTRKKPDDWDEEMDGTWEAPLISNPACEKANGCGKWAPPKVKNPLFKGKWRAPMISNVNFKGVWKARIVPNPDYFEDKTPFRSLDPIAAVGLELWTMSGGVMFDNFLITDDNDVAAAWIQQAWSVKKNAENTMHMKSSFFGNLLATANERPWLWAVFVVIVLIPVVLIAVFCFGGSKDSSAQRKKTDEPVDDEQEGEEAEVEEAEPQETEQKQKPKSSTPDRSPRRSPRKVKKADLEEDDDESEEDGASREAADAARNENAQHAADEPKASPKTGAGAARRRPRKE